MSDHEAIREVMGRYARAIDTRDYAGFTACFTQDATVEYKGHSQVLTGHAAIADLMKSVLAPLDVTQHMFSNFVIALEDDAAVLDCDILAQHVRYGAPGGDKYLAGGRYKVDLRREGNGWKIARVNAASQWSDGNPDLLPKAA